jgi:hypothetical protein
MDPQRRFDPRGLCPWLAVVAALLGSCTATPLPEPPAAGPDLGRVTAEESVGPLSNPEGAVQVSFVGGPGAADPGSALRVTNLDDAGPATATRVESDGSFRISVVLQVGNELRFETVRDGTRSAPSDALAQEDFELLPSPRFDCVEVSPGLSLRVDAGGSGEWTVRNQCETPIQAAPASFRRGDRGFGVADSGPLTVPPGSSRSFRILADEGVTPGTEDVWFVNLSVGDETVRYPLTIYTPAP